MSETTTAWLMVLIAAVNNAMGSLLLKKSRLVASEPGILGLFLSPWFWAGLMFYGMNVVIFAKALERLPVSVAYPVLAGVGFALIAIAGGFFFRERLEIGQWMGMGIILTGIILVAGK
ncbi:MAG: SMR family transporter [Pseudanabaenaceae cyanobacterium bins.68]|nr:SMR family transporter [Pseudanabaenaceae cyanobacterium bins.68]